LRVRKKSEPDRAVSKTVTNAIGLLGLFSRAEPVLAVSEFVRRLGVPRTNVVRLLATLEKQGFVERHAAGKGYQVGLRAFEIGALYLAGNPMWTVLIGALDLLVEKTQCTAYLAKLDRDDIVILTYREGTLPVRFIWQVGDRLPCTTTALGKAILAHLSDAEVDAVVGRNRPLRTLTEKSLRKRSDLDKELAQARRRGWALVREESHAGLTAVGAAVRDYKARPIAAISVSFLDYPPDARRLDNYGAFVRDTADQVSRHIAQYGEYGATLSRRRAS
jgi:DNA-binding IclR family transcriptional regulator